MEKLSERIKTWYEINEDIISQHLKKDVNNYQVFKASTFIKCGMPYFKDAFGYPSPTNNDFKYRKNELKEFFPYDLYSNSKRWNSKDKVILILGVKKQMIGHIKIQQSQKICRETKTRKKLQKLRLISSNQNFNCMSLIDLWKTIEKNYPYFTINWNLISFNDLQSNHSITECMGIWNSYLNPDINRNDFSDEENAILSHVVVEYGYENWNKIASHLNHRSSLQTYIYFFSSSTRLCPPNIRWTPEEDKRLLEAVRANSIGNNISWAKVGISLESRNKTQCYNRYLIITKYNSSKKGVFSPHENRILMDFISKYGTNFNMMPNELLPQRSLVQIKNHYNVALKHKGQILPWNYEEDVKLLEFVEKEGSNWRKLAELLGTHNRLSCRTRYLTISKFLQKNPKKSLKDVPSRLKAVTAVHKAFQGIQIDEKDDNREIEERCKAFGLATFEEFRSKYINLCKIFKTTYDYELGSTDLNIEVSQFCILKQLLNIDYVSINKRQENFLFSRNQVLYVKKNPYLILNKSVMNQIEFLKQYVQFLMPPSYSTCIGMRSLAIKKIDNESYHEFRRNEEYSKEFIIHLEKFQKVFFSLFYWSALLSKLKFSSLQEIYYIRYPKTRDVLFDRISVKR